MRWTAFGPLVPVLAVCAMLLGGGVTLTRSAGAANEDAPALPAASVRGLVLAVDKLADEPEPEDARRPQRPPVRLPACDLKVASGKLRVTCNDLKRYIVHETVPLKSLEVATEGVWVLGTLQAATRDEEGRNFPQQLIRINAVVISEDKAFTPPPVPGDLGKRMVWRSGTLHNTKGVRFSLAEPHGGVVNMQTGPDRLAIRIRPGRAEDLLKKRDQVAVTGLLDAAAKPPVLAAHELILLAAGIDRREYEAVLPPEKWPGQP